MTTFGRPDDGTTRADRIKQYEGFCVKTYIPIFSQPWWMDAICGDNWDVWLFNPGGCNLLAAMPYYFEMRGKYRYITKALLTQINGIFFRYNPAAGQIAITELQERVINEACAFLDSMHLDVYEQQYHHTFNNWQPFFWNRYTNILRYTYVIENTSNADSVFAQFSTKCRSAVRKGQRLTSVSSDIDVDSFYAAHKKIYDKQGLPVPFSEKLWKKLHSACLAHNAGKMLCAYDPEGNLHSLMFIVWDTQSMYPLLGGYMPEFSSSQSYPALTYHSIQLAGEMGLKYDFEGSMIQRIAHSFREYGGTPMPYYRIRKVFNPEILRKETEDTILAMEKDEADKLIVEGSKNDC